MFKESHRLPHFAHAGFHGIHGAFHLVAHDRQLADETLGAVLLAQVVGVDPQASQALAQLGDRRRVRAAVVVEHDHHRAARMP